MWERSHKCNLCLGDLWRMLTIEWAMLSSQRQMGSAKTKRVRQWGHKTSPIPLTPLMFSVPQHGFPHWKGQHNHVCYCCFNMLKANWQGHFSHLLFHWTRIAPGKLLPNKTIWTLGFQVKHTYYCSLGRN